MDVLAIDFLRRLARDLYGTRRSAKLSIAHGIPPELPRFFRIKVTNREHFAGNHVTGS
jgi:hypothetical protein